MKYELIVFFIFISFVPLSAAQNFYYSSECFSKYECKEWGACKDGISSRACEDITCGRKQIIERRICSSELSCQPKIVCRDWSQCYYSEKVDLLALGKITFGGYRERVCEDLSDCADSYIEETGCSEDFEIELERKAICGKEYVVAKDILSKREIARIDVDSLEANRPNIIFTEGRNTYCSECYNGVQDENEQGIDCGGNCKECAPRARVIEIGVPSVLWGGAVIFFLSAILAALFGKKPKH